MKYTNCCKAYGGRGITLKAMKFNHLSKDPLAAVKVFWGEKCLNDTPIGFPKVSLYPL